MVNTELMDNNNDNIRYRRRINHHIYHHRVLTLFPLASRVSGLCFLINFTHAQKQRVTYYSKSRNEKTLLFCVRRIISPTIFVGRMSNAHAKSTECLFYYYIIS